MVVLYFLLCDLWHGKADLERKVLAPSRSGTICSPIHGGAYITLDRSTAPVFLSFGIYSPSSSYTPKTTVPGTCEPISDSGCQVRLESRYLRYVSDTGPDLLIVTRALVYRIPSGWVAKGASYLPS